MANKYFKIKLYRSNPASVRNLLIDENKTIENLLSSIAIAFGITPGLEMKLKKNTTTIGHSALIGDIFKNTEDPDTKWEVLIPIENNLKNRYSYGFSNDSNDSSEAWHFILINEDFAEEPIEEKDKYTAPYMVRYRGYNIPKIAKSVRDFNKISQTVFRGGYYYDYYEGEVSHADIEPDSEDINRKLARLNKTGGRLVKINKSLGRPLPEIVESYRVDDIKNCIRQFNIQVETNQRKALLVSAFSKYCRSNAFLTKVIEMMSYKEYVVFRKDVTTSGSVSTYKSANVTLSQLLFIPRDSYEIKYPLELLDFFEEFIGSDEEKNMMISKKASRIVYQALDMYAAFNNQMYEKLCDIVFGEDADIDEIKGYWHRWKGSDGGLFNISWIDCDHGFICKRNVSDKKKANVLLKNPIFCNADNYFYPTKDQFEYMEVHGSLYSEDSKKKLLKAMNFMSHSYYYNYYKEILIISIYEIYKYGGNKDDVIIELKNTIYGYYEQKCYENLAIAAESVSDEVRCYKYMGYTRPEYEKLLKEGKFTVK